MPSSANFVSDFQVGEDVIGIAGLNLDFEQLNIRQDGENTSIAANGSDLAMLIGVEANSLSASNFAFV